MNNNSLSLWGLAFEEIQKTNPQLIEKFNECLLGLEVEAEGKHIPKPAAGDVVQDALSKIKELNASKEALSGKSDKIRRFFEQTIKLVISAKDFISAAVAFNPYAATAWTGICLVFPVSDLIQESF